MTRSRTLTAVIIAAAAVVFVAVYGLMDPARNFFPRCMLKQITGLDCPGCGSQRMFHALFTGDFAAAWHYNMVLMAALPVVILMLVASIMPERFPRLYRLYTHPATAYVALAVVVLWWILRNIFNV